METNADVSSNKGSTSSRVFEVLNWIQELTFYALFGVVVCWMLRNAPYLWSIDHIASLSTYTMALTAISITIMTLMRLRRPKKGEWIIILMVLGIVSGILSTLLIGESIVQSSQGPSILSTYGLKKKNLEWRLEQQDKVFKEVLHSVMGLQRLWGDKRLECEYYPARSSTREEQFKTSTERTKARMDVENASVSVMFAFDDKMDKMIRDYLTWDASVENMCAKNISRDDYQKKQLAILDAISEKVRKTQETLRGL